jgi:hypothetical protein
MTRDPNPYLRETSKTPEQMFEDGLRDLIRRHLDWPKGPSREYMVIALQREAALLKARK